MEQPKAKYRSRTRRISRPSLGPPTELVFSPARSCPRGLVCFTLNPTAHRRSCWHSRPVLPFGEFNPPIAATSQRSERDPAQTSGWSRTREQFRTNSKEVGSRTVRREEPLFYTSPSHRHRDQI